MAALVFVVVPIALVALLGVVSILRGLGERRTVFRAETPPERQLEEQDRLTALRQAEERIRRRNRRWPS